MEKLVIIRDIELVQGIIRDSHLDWIDAPILHRIEKIKYCSSCCCFHVCHFVVNVHRNVRNVRVNIGIVNCGVVIITADCSVLKKEVCACTDTTYRA